jgi:hypothetical protein
MSRRREGNGRRRVQGLQIAEGDPATRALAVRLSIEEQDRVARSVQEFGAAKHVPTVAAHGVRQHDGSKTGTAGRKPGPNAAARSAGEGNRRRTWESARGRTDLAWHGCRQRGAEQPGNSRNTTDREHENEDDPDSTHGMFEALPDGRALSCRARRPGRLGAPKFQCQTLPRIDRKALWPDQLQRLVGRRRPLS